MRAHIVNSLSDEQIRSLHIEAEKQLQAIMESQQKAEEELWVQYAENSARCKDIAFSTKNQAHVRYHFIFQNQPGRLKKSSSAISWVCAILQKPLTRRKNSDACLEPTHKPIYKGNPKCCTSYAHIVLNLNN